MAKLYELILIPWLIIAIIIFFALLKINAPYGKFLDKSFKIKLPYKIGWFLQEIISPISLLFFFLYNNTQIEINLTYFFIFLWVLHYIYRSIIFPLRMKSNTSQIPLAIMFSAIFLCILYQKS